MEFVYRFRSVDALLGKRAELEKQTIFFASKAQLNDPVEGYKDLFWRGDSIAWKNFLRHYLLCLMQVILRALENDDAYEVTEDTLESSLLKGDSPMNVITRRDALRASGLAFAAPLAGSLLPQSVFAQSDNPSIIFNNDLATYETSVARNAFKAIRNGSLSASHLQHAASSTHHFARHLERINADKQFSSSIESLDYDTFTAQRPQYHAKVLAAAQAIDPTVRPEDIGQASVDRTTFEDIKSKIRAGGLSYAYHSIAECYSIAGAKLAANDMQSIIMDPKLRPHLSYGLASPGHLLKVATCVKPAKDDCQLLSRGTIILDGIGLLVGIVCIFIPGVDFLCFAIALSLLIHGNLLNAIYIALHCF